MNITIFRREHINSAYVILDTKKCIACWKCMDVCSNHVFGRINLPWHKHIRFVHSSACKGCMKCTKICTTGALSKPIKGGRNEKTN